MAAPNIVNISTIYGKTVGGDLTTTLTTAHLVCPADKVLKINNIVTANIDGTDAVNISITFYDSSAVTSYALASTIALPANSTLVVLAKDSSIYLEEGDEIRGGASADSDAQIIISYEELDDATL